ncbi:MAG: CDP-alcohol phosphatidyltransferase family protein [candidate division Zixibacteria bacterium]|nr:CDP-alcohol phosphatidyltransferase family protein [candidate division Zixibacteria bacterium]
MAEFKLLNKHLVKAFLMVIEPLARVFINLKVHPHVVTFTGLIFSILAALSFVYGKFFSAGVLIILAGICDVLDGRLARETNTLSKFGALFDSTIDRYSEVLIFLGLSSYFLVRGSYLVLIIIFAIAGSFMVSYTRARAEGLGIECKVGIMQRQERITFLAAGAILGSIPGTSNLFLLLSIWTIAIFANITVIQRIIYINRQLEKV